MKDYQKQLNKYLDFPENRREVEEYLERYWLDKKELDSIWLKIKNDIFNPSFYLLPEPVFNKDFNVIILKGGAVLYREEFERLQSCMKIVGDRYFIVLEDYDENNPPHQSGPPLRFKYPVDVTWDTIMRGADISNQVFTRPVRMYFVFGDSGHWGKYAADDYNYPLNFIGFKKQYSDLFHNKFKIPKEDVIVLKEWVAFYGMKFPGVD